jgi:hypothetical protein
MSPVENQVDGLLGPEEPEVGYDVGAGQGAGSGGGELDGRLIEAARRGDSGEVRRLLGRGAGVNAKDRTEPG